VNPAPVALAAALLLALPGTASADVIFDPADADDLAATLAEAYTDQNVCYGWHVTVQDVATTSESIGSNFGADKPIESSCPKSVEFTATITYTSESSESEDSASFDVHSTPPGIGRDDLLALDLDFDALTGDDPDVVVGKAVTALPLLAADKGLAKPLEASPETGATPADAQLTDDPGSDWWRNRGGMLIWALILIAASGVLIWAVLKTSRRRPSPAAVPAETPLYVPDVIGERADPDLAPATKRHHEPPHIKQQPETPPPANENSATEPAASPAIESPTDSTSPDPASTESPRDTTSAEATSGKSPAELPSTEGDSAAEPEPVEPPDSALPDSALPEPALPDSASAEPASAETTSPKHSPAGTPPESAVDDSPKPSDQNDKE
jgi:hypothetical protein